MIKFTDHQNVSKQVRMDYLLLKLLSKDMKTKAKNKDQPISSHKNNRKIEVIGNISPTVDNYSRKGKMKDTDS